MNLIIINFLLFLLIVFGNGFLVFKKILKINNEINFYEILVLGLVFTIFLSQIINILLPLNDYVTLANLLIVSFFLLSNRSYLKYVKIDYKIFVLFLFLIFIQIYGSDFSDDLDHYHYAIISNTDKNNLIWGNSFFHDMYGTFPIWLVTHSYLNFGPSILQDIHILNGLFFFIFLGLYLSEIKKDHKIEYSSKIILFTIFIFVVMKFTRLKEFGIDRPAILFFCLIIYYYLKYFFLINKENIRNNFIIISLISLVIISIKITYVPILIFPIFLLINYKNQLFVFEKKYFLIFFATLVFILKNILSTGCVVYPVEISCLEFLNWSNMEGANDLSFLAEYFNKSWSSYEGSLAKAEYIKNFNWIETWFNRGKTEILELLLTTVLVFIITSSIFGFEYTNNNNKFVLSSLRKILLIITISSLLIYFLKNPVTRMNLHILISLLIILVINFTNLSFNFAHKIKINIFLILVISFNFYKNIDRIHRNNFINNPVKSIISKIDQPIKHNLDGFIYYTGWYGNSPIGKKILKDKKYEKKLIFHIISKK